MEQRLGIIAGAGSLPKAIFDNASIGGDSSKNITPSKPPYVIALKNIADNTLVPSLPSNCVSVHRLGGVGGMLVALRRAGVKHLCMIGSVKRPSFSLGFLSDIWLDWTGILWMLDWLFRRRYRSGNGDDSFLRYLTGRLERYGFVLVGAQEFAPNLMAPVGHIAGTARFSLNASGQLTGEGSADIYHGWQVAKVMGQYDIGQAVVVNSNRVLAVEAAEGTDAMLERCAGLGKSTHGGVLIKRVKPTQDRRLDLPTIGAKTVENAAKAGLKTIVVSAGSTFVADIDSVCQLADKYGISIYGLPEIEDNKYINI